MEDLMKMDDTTSVRSLETKNVIEDFQSSVDNVSITGDPINIQVKGGPGALITSGDGYVSVGGGDLSVYPSADEAANTLALCQHYLIGPYDMLLSVIGWRKFRNRDTCSGCFKLLNLFYPVFILSMLVIACIAQIASCFSRTKDTVSIEKKNGTHFHILRCDNHLVTLDVISDTLIIVSYLISLYTFRVAAPEHLFSLAETALLSFNGSSLSKSRRKPLFILLGIFFAGIGFFLASISISVLRLFALQLEKKDTIIGWYSSDLNTDNQTKALILHQKDYNILHYTLVVVSLFGFTFFDLLYIAVIINYCSQCQLLTFYIDNLQDKVRNKKYPNLKVAIKEIHGVREFLRTLNGNVSTVSSLILLIFISNAIRSYSSLILPGQNTISIITGFLNTTQWTVGALFPAILAAQLTAKGNQLRRLGQEIAARPFYYSDTPELELKFFLDFTEYTRYEAYLAFIPMQPSLVLGFGYVFLVLISSGIVISQVESVTWF